MNSRLLLILLGLCTSPVLHSQNNKDSANPWKSIPNAPYIEIQQVTEPTPSINKQFSLNISVLVEALPKTLKSTAPDKQPSPTLSIPFPDGSFHEFEIFETQTMHPALADRFPGIKTYEGRQVDNPDIILRADFNHQGFHAMILGGNSGSTFIKPVTKDGETIYLVYHKQGSPEKPSWSCKAKKTYESTGQDLFNEVNYRSPGCKLRTYRLALACTGEYAQYHGGSVEEALAAMATSINRVNGIFERDLGVHLELVANNDELIFLLPNADPFSNNNGALMLGENQTLCDEIIGTEHYDLGHVFSTGGGGIAIVGSVCKADSKACGVTGSPYPEGDAFDIDYVSHELGHQFGANHTQNNPCNHNPATSVEPGSGSTIMSYAGVCAPNVQVNSDAYFHAINIGEIKNYMAGDGDVCAHISGENQCPVADAGIDYFIPHSTPFELSGSGYDPDTADILSYCWEQMDNQIAIMPPYAGNITGPSFRSFPPSSKANRFFPELSLLRSGLEPTWEVLPNQSRSLKFMLTVRDNHIGGGCSAQDEISIHIEGQAGPFEVIEPGSQTTWVSGRSPTIHWNVAGTNLAPIDCSEVDILLSLDGGLTWDLTLKEATPNDGEAKITVPNLPTQQARVMVRSKGNIFFAISKSDITIVESSEFSLTTQSSDISCFGKMDGSASVSAFGGEGVYEYLWSNGMEGETIKDLKAGIYTVTVSSGLELLTGVVEIKQPEPLELNLEGTEADRGSNGEIEVKVTGGKVPYAFNWQDGANGNPIVHLPAGDYSVTVTDANGCKISDTHTLRGTPHLPLEYGTVENVGESWQVIQLKNSYERMVVVTSIELPGKMVASVVTRVKNADRNEFELKLQRAGASDLPIKLAKVHYLVVEEGAYSDSKYGVNFEAWRTSTSKTSTRGNWVFERQSFVNKYKSPVVIGQVMSFNDHHWSSFWSSRYGRRQNIPSPFSLSIGKHAGQDQRDEEGASEEIGYLVFESGSGYLNGKRFFAKVGQDKIRGITDAGSGFTYAFEGFSEAEMAIVGSSGMNDNEGAWPVLDANGLTNSAIRLFALEDQCQDEERSHSSEQIAYLIFGTGDPSHEEGVDQENVSERPDPEYYLHAYPSPSPGLVNLVFFQSEPGGPQVFISDVFGRSRDKFTLLHSEPGMRQVKLDLSHFSPGTYILQIMEGMTRKSIKIVLN